MSTITNDHIEIITNNVIQNQISAVEAPTGSGKSTVIVNELYKQGTTLFIVEPTIVACRSLYKSMYKLFGLEDVGYAAERDIHYTNSKLTHIRKSGFANRKNTGIVYCTGGHMKRVMLDCVKYARENMLDGNFNNVDLLFCDILIIDEVHVGSVEIDMIMYLYKYLHDNGAHLPRLILASATFNIRDTPFQTAPVHKIELQRYKVDIQYHSRKYDPTENALYTDLVNVILEKHNTIEIGNSDIWLVFCPGSYEIDKVIGKISEYQIPNIELVPVHGQLDSEQNEKIGEPVKDGMRRIIVATNIAESAITIEDLSGVFDTMTEKYGEESQTGGFRLVLKQSTKASSRQRAGRTGRTRPGFCYRMITETHYQELEESRVREINRVPIHTTLIELLNVGIDIRTFFGPDFNLDRVKKSLALLSNLNLYTQNPLKVTEKGNFVSQFEFSVQGSSVLYEAIKSNLEPFTAIVLVNLIETYGPSYFHYPKDTTGRNFWNANFKAYNGPDDVHVLLNLWSSLYDLIENIMFTSNNARKIANAIRGYHFNVRKIIELVKNIERTVFQLKDQYMITIGRINIPNLIKNIIPIYKSTYKDRTYIMAARHQYVHQDDPSTFFSTNNKKPLQYNNPASEIIGLSIFETTSGVGITKRIITLYANSAEHSIKENVEPIYVKEKIKTVIPGLKIIYDGEEIKLPDISFKRKPRPAPYVVQFYEVTTLDLLPALEFD